MAHTRLPELHGTVLDVELEAEKPVGLPARIEQHPPAVADERKPKPSQPDDGPFPPRSRRYGVVPHHQHDRRRAMDGEIPVADAENVIAEVLERISQIPGDRPPWRLAPRQVPGRRFWFLIVHEPPERRELLAERLPGPAGHGESFERDRHVHSLPAAAALRARPAPRPVAPALDFDSSQTYHAEH